MTTHHAVEINANLERAEQSIAAARQLLAGQFLDFAASRAYYAAFYAATALLLRENLELSKHSAVIALIHQKFVKTGKLDKEHGKRLNWLFELRGRGVGVAAGRDLRAARRCSVGGLAEECRGGGGW